VNRASGSSRVKSSETQGNRPSDPAADGLQLSAAGDRFRQLRTRVESLPESGQPERVARLKALVDAGEYQVDGQRVAKAMLEDEPTAALLGLKPARQ
jgi:flagellar biosynthesis anti-sigma factor FlgM